MTRSLSVRFLSLVIACLFSVNMTTVQAASIVPDGQTATTVATSGKVSDITTSTVSGNTGFNSFKQFDVKKGATANLHLPNGTSHLLNLVHNRRTTIDGILNAFQNGAIGGNIFFLNPHGIVIGANGVVNVGSFTAITPTRDFMKNFFDAPGAPNAAAVDQVFAGTVPLRGSSVISVKGDINARTGVALLAGDVNHYGSIVVSDLVNTQGLQAGNGLAVENGVVSIVAVDDVKITGQIVVNGSDNVDGGSIYVDAGDVITVNKDAKLSARGQGANSDGGEIIVMAQDDAKLDDNAILDARGGEISGNGGFIEFSAKDKVDIDGGELLASATNGAAGNILLDPTILNLDIDVFTSGANMTFEADERINVNGVTVSSRQIAGADHVNDDSIGDSGGLEFYAPEIYFNSGSKILAHANNGFDGGWIAAEAHYNGVGTSDPIELKVHAIDSLFKGDDVGFIANGFVNKTNLMSDEIVTNISAEVKIGSGTVIEDDGTSNIIASAGAITNITETDIPDEINIIQNVTAHTIVENGASISAVNGLIVLSEADNYITADLSNVDNVTYEEISSVFSNTTTESKATIAKGAEILGPTDLLEVISNSETKINISILHQKQDSEIGSAAIAVSEVSNTAEALIAANLDLPVIVIESSAEIQSQVEATTEFPVTFTAFDPAVFDDVPLTLTTAASQHHNSAKGGFIEGAVVDVDFLALAVVATDDSTLVANPGITEENSQVRGIIDGDFHNTAEHFLYDTADVTANKYYEVFVLAQASESIDGLSEISKKEITDDLGNNTIINKLYKLQKESSSTSDSSFEFSKVVEMDETSDSTSEEDSNMETIEDSGVDPETGAEYSYTETTSDSTSSDSSSSSSSSSSSESTSTSESGSSEDSTSSVESTSTSSSSSSSSSSEDE